MPIFRKVLGPFNREYNNQYGAEPEIRWYFIVIRDNHQTAHYTLIYNAKKKTFTANNSQIDHISTDHRHRVERKFYPGQSRIPVRHPEMFIGEKIQVISGPTVYDILKRHLRDEDVAIITQSRILGRLP